MLKNLKSKIEAVFIPIQWIILYIFDFIFKVKGEKKVQFVVGVDEIANNIYFFKNLFLKESISVNLAPNKYYRNNNYDYELNFSNKYIQYFVRLFYGPYLLAKLSNQADVFIYFWWTGFCVDRELDYKFLKNKNKKIVCMFIGSDIRSLKLYKEVCLKKCIDSYAFYNTLNNEYKNEKRVKNVAKLADTYSHLIFNNMDQVSYLKSKQIQNRYRLLNSYLNKNDKKFVKMSLPIVVHAPSNPLVKGTQLVRAAIKKLEIDGYKFQYVELINKPNEEVLHILNNSHIVLNQFYAFIPGLFGIEAMSKYNAVLMSADYENLPGDSTDAWLCTKYWEVYDNLKYLLDNPDKIKEYAQRGYDFVKNNYTEEKVRNFYIDTFYEHKIIDDKSIFSK